ncbi:gastrin-releasing peptide [Mastacembelus armatus]|uniref:gastrin-releasing peptide n=1 Tax=Mastacembelus armatus TaxID=205130 RepID=UPI000E45E585|nr:gastrin-releasing peptide [Mastacembelus armatus]
MGGVCFYYSWTCRPVWPVFIFLATIPCVLRCSQTPAAAIGKMYPRGNHWAVGHLMGKKSTESLPHLQETNPDSDYLTPSGSTPVTQLDRYEHLMQVLMQQKKQKQMKPKSTDRLLHLRSSWREEDRDKYLREMSDLLLLALNLQDNDSS